MSNFVDSSNLGIILTKIRTWAEGKFQTVISADNKIPYSNISGTPTIPTVPNLSKGTTSGSGNAVTDISVSGHQITLTKGSTFLTEHQDISGKVDKVTGKGLSTNDYTTTDKNLVKKLADTSDTGFYTKAFIRKETNEGSWDYITPDDITIGQGVYLSDALAEYQTSSQVSTAINNAIKDITGFDFEVVTSLPSTGVKGKIYLKAHNHGAGDAYDEYIWTGSAFEKIGSTDMDLSGYVPTTRKINNKALSSDITLTASDVNAAPSEHTHSYTNDSALTATQIKTAFVNAGYYTDSTYPA